VEETTTLRERKKDATRQALHEAALRLALEHGLDTVTRDAIADEANVSRRTFSNYFASKEDAILHGDRVRVQQLLERLRARPANESPWQALTTTTLAHYRERGDLDPDWLARLRLLRRHPSILAQQMTANAQLEDELATEIAKRDPGHADEPMRSRVMASAFLTTLRVVAGIWAEANGPEPLDEAIRAGLARLAERFE
jgi:AcrR family transcriptional regulator